MTLRTRVFPFVLLAATVSAQSLAPAWEMAQPDAKLLIGINLKGIRESSLGRSLSAQATQQIQQATAALQSMPMMTKLPGLELLSDIDSVLISSPGEAPAVKTGASATTPGTPAKAPGAAKKNPPFLLVLRGTFPDEHVRPLLTGKHPSYKAVNIYGATGTDSPSLAVLNESTILFGDERSIRGAIDRRGTKPVIAGVFQRAQELSAQNDVWVIAKDIASGLQQTAAGNPFASQIDGMEVALQMNDGLGLNLALATKTEAAANMFAQMLTMQMQSVAASKGGDPKVAEMMQKLQVGAKGNRMTVRLALSADEVQESIQAAQAARMNAGRATASIGSAGTGTTGSTTGLQPSERAAVTARPEPVPAGPRKVRIYGLDDGVREITLEPRPR